MVNKPVILRSVGVTYAVAMMEDNAERQYFVTVVRMVWLILKSVMHKEQDDFQSTFLYI